MDSSDTIVGIDLGTTNSEIAAFVDGKVQIIGPGNSPMLPSCVGLSKAGDLLIGAPARNQQLLYPELTVRSIKRKMGSSEKITLGPRTFSPQEISALLLRELAEWAKKRLGSPVRRAVISVPAYFSDSQRNATREAGELAGLEVVRILNEPTAASLAYGYGSDERLTVMIYDLGGGTFDVSIVTTEDEVTEVLASHGNNRLGGDDFNELLVERLLDEFVDTHGIDLRNGHSAALARLWWAAEGAKKRLSFQPFVNIREEALANKGGVPLHLETEISREEFEDMIRPLMESTLDCVSKAMNDAGKGTGDLDAILLVGGSTRIPMVSKALEERTGVSPRHEIHPDLCVALGAGVMGSRLAGHDVERVLVDVTPYSFGPSYLGERDGSLYPYCYHPIIRSNTPLPVTRTEKYYTSFPFQSEVRVEIFQGEDPDALKNIPVGNFRITGLQTGEEPNTVLCRMSLDVDGILKVTATEKSTGKSKQITIDNALRPMSDGEIATARKRLQALYDSRSAEMGDLDDLFEETRSEDVQKEAGFRDNVIQFPGARKMSRDDLPSGAARENSEDLPQGEDDEWTVMRGHAQALLDRSRGLLDSMHHEDREEAIDLHDQIESALASKDAEGLAEACDELKELLFFVEGK
ncbi:MAG: Hsp70 family protein [Deltaproteobacteria bacterium]|nr:Hsp70 family protein [Deltaproteobacteria bacterium]